MNALSEIRKIMKDAISEQLITKRGVKKIFAIEGEKENVEEVAIKLSKIIIEQKKKLI